MVTIPGCDCRKQTLWSCGRETENEQLLLIGKYFIRNHDFEMASKKEQAGRLCF